MNRTHLLKTDFIFAAGAYLDVARADADYVALRRSHVDSGSTYAFDCVTLGRKSTGEVHMHRAVDSDEAIAGPDEPAWSIAGGLALAMFLSIGGDVPASQVRERETLGAVAGMVAGAFGRADIYEFGTLLDACSAGLIVATSSMGEDRVHPVLAHADASMTRLMSIDLADVERADRDIAARHRRGDASS